MTDLVTLFPRQKVPALTVDLVGGGKFSPAGKVPDKLTMIVFYRGPHRPLCKLQLTDLQTKLSRPRFADLLTGLDFVLEADYSLGARS